jgi:hypothetical protein
VSRRDCLKPPPPNIDPVNVDLLLPGAGEADLEPGGLSVDANREADDTLARRVELERKGRDIVDSESGLVSTGMDCRCLGSLAEGEAACGRDCMGSGEEALSEGGM